MGVYTSPQGFGVAANPLTDSPYTIQSDFGTAPPPPPGEEFMITETGIFMIDETTLDRMITE